MVGGCTDYGSQQVANSRTVRQSQKMITGMFTIVDEGWGRAIVSASM